MAGLIQDEYEYKSACFLLRTVTDAIFGKHENVIRMGAKINPFGGSIVTMLQPVETGLRDQLCSSRF